MAKRREQATKKKASAAGRDPFFRPFEKLGAKPKKKADHAQKNAAAPAPPVPQKAKPAPEEAAPAPVDPATFAIYMAGVRALEDGATRIPRTASRLERAARAADSPPDLDAEARAKLRAIVAEGYRFETVDDGERIEGRRLDVDPRELRRLRRGAHAVDGKLDLHGMSAGGAREAVEEFVKKRAASGDVVVLLVHGKGSHSPRGVGVLRGEIAAWLTEGRAARHVRAFASAPEHADAPLGSPSGALLVLLAR
ncbi:MAG TPA: Smr/MutS family protein [Minicystis sp.]|nr:Smr/MutS family protein [Minicystis sp.]